MKHLTLWFTLALALVLPQSAHADELMMVRMQKPFNDAMVILQDIIRAQGYQVMRVQRVDVGLQSRGFATAEYRVVFFGKPAEVQQLGQQYPDLLPYLPLKITMIAEGDSTLAITNSPQLLGEFYKAAGLQPVFKRWEKDVRGILDDLMLLGG